MAKKKPKPSQIAAMSEWIAGTMSYQQLWELAFEYYYDVMEEEPDTFWRFLKEYGLELWELEEDE